jgi:signal transduction histidine kinase
VWNTDDPIGGLSEELWRQAFKDIRTPAVIIGRDLRVSGMNEAAAVLLGGRDLEAAIGQMALDSIRSAYPQGEDLCSTLGSCEGTAFSMIGLKDDLAVLLIAADNDLDVLADFSTLYVRFKEAAYALQARNDRLEVYHELLTHDAPNFITAIYGYLQMIQAQELPREKLTKYIDSSIKQTEALNQMIDNARTLRQLETTLPDQTVPLDLRRMVEEGISRVRVTTKEKASSIEDRIPSGTYLVQGEQNLAEVFRIILTNAVRYSDSPQVSIELRDDGDSWHLRFIDNGRGIPEEKKEFVFLRFDRLDKQKKIRGSGLSLALARALVERYGGRIWVDDRVPGDHTKGSVFHVRLPKV